VSRKPANVAIANKNVVDDGKFLRKRQFRNENFKESNAHVPRPRVQPSFVSSIMTVSILEHISIPDVPLLSSSAGHHGETTMTPPDLLVSSPYEGLEHHLNLSSVSENSEQLALALAHLRPTTVQYPSQPYATSFNWQEVVSFLPSDYSGRILCLLLY
jgi:hypothetical protein